MRIIFTFLVGIFLSSVNNIAAQQKSISNFLISYDQKTGSIQSIVNSSDLNQMNWIFNSSDSNLKWQLTSQDWGLGQYWIGGQNISWDISSKLNSNGNDIKLAYKTKYLDINVKRQEDGLYFLETYEFKNTTPQNIKVEGISIYTPFNDNYPDAKISATNRCNAHIWPGLNSSYVNAIRMNGKAKHLGLVFTKGAMIGYSIANREIHKNIPWKYSASNIRGTIALNIESFNLKPGETYSVQWKLFWHNGWDDFYKKAEALGFVRLEANKYVIEKNENLTISVNANTNSGLKNKQIIIKGNSLGEHSYTLHYGKGKNKTILNYLVISSAKNLIDNRVNFIIQHQQMNKISDPRFGAYMVYDNEGDSLYTNFKKNVNSSDRDEGRERIGMGVFVAKWLQHHTDSTVYTSFMRYVKFVREKFQNAEYKVFSNIAHTSPHRSYNYPWVAHLYLETYKLTKEKTFLEDYYQTMNKYFLEFGYKHYSIDFRVTDALEALNSEGMITQRNVLLNHYKQLADFFIENGIFYPSHEVNYEQSIVAPAVTFLCEMYLVTKGQKYLDAARIQLPSLEAFNGKQPDVHLNEIAIRHWDGFWFGKREMWGDVMPHYWSTLTAIAYTNYYKCTGEIAYKKKAERIVENNLLNFKENGRASCAFLYPDYINNISGKFYDPFANDQDWALVFYIEIMEN